MTAIVLAATLSAQRSRQRRPDLWDDLVATSISESIADSVTDIVNSIAAARRASAELSRLIAAARTAYWEQYPNGPRRAQAEAEFASRLLEKDLTLATMFVDGGCRSDRGYLLAEVTNARRIDGGIPAPAWSPYCRWIDAIRRDIRSFSDLATWGLTALNRPEYETYRKARDWEELYRAGKAPYRTAADFFKSEKPAVYLLGLVYSRYPNGMHRDSQASFPERLVTATETVATMVAEHGMDRLVATVASLQKAPRVADRSYAGAGRLTDAASIALGCTKVFADDCFWELVRKYPTWKSETPTAPTALAAAAPTVAVTDAERAKWTALAESRDPLEYAQYAAWFIVKDRYPLDTVEGRAESAQNEFASWTKQYGGDAIRRTVEGVRAVPKGPKGEIFQDAATRLGCMVCSTTAGGCQPAYCLHESLARGGVRAAPAPPPAGGRSGRPLPAGGSPVAPAAPAPTVGTYRQGQLPLKVKHVDPEFPAGDPAPYMVMLVEITVGIDGRVTSARAMRQLRAFGPAAVAAVKQWQFDPTGMTKPATGLVQVEFRR